MTFIPYNPELDEHQEAKLYECVPRRIETDEGTMFSDEIEPADVDREVADKTPWFYYVRVLTADDRERPA